jgi:hypothetical protein
VAAGALEVVPVVAAAAAGALAGARPLDAVCLGAAVDPLVTVAPLLAAAAVLGTVTETVAPLPPLPPQPVSRTTASRTSSAPAMPERLSSSEATIS